MAATAGWFFYDGLIRYPHLNRGHEKHVELERQGRADEWTELAAKEGWPAKPQTEPLDIGQQYFFGGFAGAIALGIGVWVLISIRRSVRSDADSVYGATGRRVPFDAVRRIDMRKWDSKGIAVLHYEQAGREKKLIVDDYKYEGAAVILDEIKAFQQARRDQTEA